MKQLLNPAVLIAAYSHGYFPMPDPVSNEVQWYRPDPRAIIPLDKFHVSHSLRRRLNKNTYTVTYDQQFRQVMQDCANREETWITPEFIEIYLQLFELGKAHSIEIWDGERLIGGTYGVCIGGAFFAESMFHIATDASKLALYFLVERLKQQGFTLLECQFRTPHLSSLGAIEITDEAYMAKLSHAIKQNLSFF